MSATASLPPELAALARSAAGPLKPITIRLDPACLAEVDQLAKTLGGADRAALLRFVVRQGLAATAAQLDTLTLACSRPAGEQAHPEGLD